MNFNAISKATFSCGIAIRLRCLLIKALAGDMPVVLNMAIYRPHGFKGVIARFGCLRPYIFERNILFNESRDEILIPIEDCPGSTQTARALED